MMHLKIWILNIIRSGQLRYLHNKVLFFQKPLFVIAKEQDPSWTQQTQRSCFLSWCRWPVPWPGGAGRPCWGRGGWPWPGGGCRGDRSSCPPGGESRPRCWGWSWRWRASPGPWSHSSPAPAPRCAPTPRTWGSRWWRWSRTPAAGNCAPSHKCPAPRISSPGNIHLDSDNNDTACLTLGTTTTSSTLLLSLGTVLTWHS